MDWFQVDTKDMLFGPFTPSEKGMLVVILSLTAHLERIPTDDEVLQLPGVGRKAIATLTEKLRNTDATLSQRQRNIIEAATKIQLKKEGSKLRMRDLRSKDKDVTRNNDVTLRESRRTQNMTEQNMTEHDINNDNNDIVLEGVLESSFSTSGENKKIEWKGLRYDDPNFDLVGFLDTYVEWKDSEGKIKKNKFGFSGKIKQSWIDDPSLIAKAIIELDENKRKVKEAAQIRIDAEYIDKAIRKEQNRVSAELKKELDELPPDRIEEITNDAKENLIIKLQLTGRKIDWESKIKNEMLKGEILEVFESSKS